MFTTKAPTWCKISQEKNLYPLLVSPLSMLPFWSRGCPHMMSPRPCLTATSSKHCMLAWVHSFETLLTEITNALLFWKFSPCFNPFNLLFWHSNSHLHSQKFPSLTSVRSIPCEFPSYLSSLPFQSQSQTLLLPVL